MELGRRAVDFGEIFRAENRDGDGIVEDDG
jgi:hypothetical protein